MKDLLIIFVILLVLLILISTLGGSMNLPTNTIQAFTQPSPKEETLYKPLNMAPPQKSALMQKQKEMAIQKGTSIEPFDATAQYAAL